MAMGDIREFLKDIPGADRLSMTYAANGNQIFHLGDKSVEVSPIASNEEIRQALVNPTVPTANTKVTVKPMSGSALQGFGQKLSKLKHDAEFDAGKLAARVDSLSARKDAAIAK